MRTGLPADLDVPSAGRTARLEPFAAGRTEGMIAVDGLAALRTGRRGGGSRAGPFAHGMFAADEDEDQKPEQVQEEHQQRPQRPVHAPFLGVFVYPDDDGDP